VFAFVALSMSSFKVSGILKYSHTNTGLINPHDHEFAKNKLAPNWLWNYFPGECGTALNSIKQMPFNAVPSSPRKPILKPVEAQLNVCIKSRTKRFINPEGRGIAKVRRRVQTHDQQHGSNTDVVFIFYKREGLITWESGNEFGMAQCGKWRRKLENGVSKHGTPIVGIRIRAMRLRCIL
jgi:hypothetical protein